MRATRTVCRTWVPKGWTIFRYLRRRSSCQWRASVWFFDRNKPADRQAAARPICVIRSNHILNISEHSSLPHNDLNSVQCSSGDHQPLAVFTKPCRQVEAWTSCLVSLSSLTVSTCLTASGTFTLFINFWKGSDFNLQQTSCSLSSGLDLCLIPASEINNFHISEVLVTAGFNVLFRKSGDYLFVFFYTREVVFDREIGSSILNSRFLSRQSFEHQHIENLHRDKTTETLCPRLCPVGSSQSNTPVGGDETHEQDAGVHIEVKGWRTEVAVDQADEGGAAVEVEDP